MVERVQETESAEIFGDVAGRGPMVVICEHASRQLPPPMSATEGDDAILAAHWGWDIGAAEVSREIVRQSNSVGLLAPYSRLVCDLNREPDDPTWIRQAPEGHVLSFNVGVDAAERECRFLTYHEPFHALADRLLNDRVLLGGDVLLLSVHSFTPVFGDEVRDVEVGVLYDSYPSIAERLRSEFEEEGFYSLLNEPYSGIDNVMYAAKRHGLQYGVVYLEIEIRQDLIATAAEARAVGQRLARGLARLRLRSSLR